MKTVRTSNNFDDNGEIVSFDDDIEKSRKALNESLVIARDLGDRLLIARALETQQMCTNDRDEVKKICQECLKIYEELGDKWNIARMSGNLGKCAFHTEDYKEAEKLFAESLNMFKEIGQKYTIIWATEMLAEIALEQDELEKAEQLFTDVRDLKNNVYKSMEWEVEMPMADWLTNMGEIEKHKKNYEDAISLFSQSLQIWERLGEKSRNRYRIASLLCLLGEISRIQGNYVEARRQLTESLKMCNKNEEKVQHKRGVAQTLYEFGKLAEVEGNADQAATFFIIAVRTYESMGFDSSGDIRAARNALGID